MLTTYFPKKSLTAIFESMNISFYRYQIPYSRFRIISFLILFVAVISQSSICQIVTLPNIIGSNMVLQQNTQVPLWGWAKAGTTVEINAGWSKTIKTKTNASGKWMAKIRTPKAKPGQAPAYTLTISGPENQIKFTNILIGEVWLCSGQSNMWFPMGYFDAGSPGVVNSATEIAEANYPNIRLFTVPLKDSTVPVYNCGGAWTACNPTTVSMFSAVAYYFGRELFNNKALNVPIGLINNSYGGTSVQAWMSDSLLRSDNSFKLKYIDADYSSSKVFIKPSLVYNAMLVPIMPYALKGVIWYQGESNVGNDEIYTRANMAMINDWRASWGIDFSFYAVQMTPRFKSLTQKDLTVDRGFFREFQTNIMSSPKTGIVVTSDLLLNYEERIKSHPHNKKDVGKRLALWALAKDYAQPVQYLGPMYQSYSIEGDKVRISFKPESLGSGLTTKDGGVQVTNFRIAGSDKKCFYPAQAMIEGNTIVVSSPFVSSPASVRYAFTDGAITNLINKEGLPAYQFRTDTWNQWPTIPYIDLP